MITINFEPYNFKIKEEENRKYIFDIVRRKYVVLTPEEWVRQHIIWYFIHQLNYPKSLISVEKQIKINGIIKRYDLVVFQRDMKPWMMVECKEFDTELNDIVLQQLLRYQQKIQSPYGVITNGRQTFCCEMNIENFKWLEELPIFNK